MHPHDVARRGVVDGIEVLTARQERAEPTHVRWLAVLLDHLGVATEHGHPVGLHDAGDAGAEHGDTICTRRFRDRRAQGERRQARVGAIVVDDANALHRHAVDRVDFRGEQGDQVVVGQRDHQFVDCPAGAVLEDLDRQHVTAHRPDPARHLAQRAGSVRHPDSDDDGDHAAAR